MTRCFTLKIGFKRRKTYVFVTLLNFKYKTFQYTYPKRLIFTGLLWPGPSEIQKYTHTYESRSKTESSFESDTRSSIFLLLVMCFNIGKNERILFLLYFDK